MNQELKIPNPELRAKMKRIRQAVFRVLENKATQEEIQNFQDLPDSEIAQAFGEAIQSLELGGTVYQYKLGGDYVDEAGKDRKRVVARMDIEKLSERYSFLKYFVAKFIPKDENGKHEADIQQHISDIAENSRGALKVPSLIARVETNEEQVLIIERLEKDSHNNTLQSFIDTFKKDKRAFAISDAISEQIESAITTLHREGVNHGDINEGNFYIQNAEFRTITTVYNGQNVSLELLLRGEVVLLDFELSEMSDQVLQEKEDEQVEQMIIPYVFEYTDEYSSEEIADSYADWRKSRNAA